MLVRINDIKNEELRELIKKRTLEQHNQEFLDYCIDDNDILNCLFVFDHTPEGHEFWMDVCHGIITEI